VKQPDKKVSIQLVPAASNDQQLRLLVEKKQVIRIIDASGRLLLRRMIDAKPGIQTLFVPGLQRGLYFLVTSESTQSFWY
jgi:hypothetical protein